MGGGPPLAPSGPTGLQAAETAAYRRFPYPTLIHRLTHPDRLATIARLAGMAPPDIRTARVLEIGVSTGMNLLSMAQATPNASFVGFDLDPDAIAKGREWLAMAGLDNVRLEVLDLLDGADALASEFDYIIAHGLFAWVPEPVADALFGLIARTLSPQGVAFVSFNALPGCYARLPVRDAMLRAAAGAVDDGDRVARARAALQALAEPRDKDSPAQAGLRATARTVLEKPDGVLLHDELGAVYRPRYLHDVLAEADAKGLAFLGDASPELLGEAFLTDGEPEADQQAQVERRACAGDEAAFRFFRSLLLVRRGAAPDRVPTSAAIEALYAASGATESEPNVFAQGDHRVRIDHPGLKAVLQRLIAAWPGRVQVRDLGLDAELLIPLIGLFDFDLLTLHTIDAPFATEAGAHPVTSPLARMMLNQRMPWTANLNHRPAKLDPFVSAAVLALDGRPDDGRFVTAIRDAGVDRRVALATIAAQALILP